VHRFAVRRIVLPKFRVTVNSNHPTEQAFVSFNNTPNAFTAAANSGAVEHAGDSRRPAHHHQPRHGVARAWRRCASTSAKTPPSPSNEIPLFPSFCSYPWHRCGQRTPRPARQHRDVRLDRRGLVRTHHVRERVDAGVNERIELWNRTWIVSPSGVVYENTTIGGSTPGWIRGDDHHVQRTRPMDLLGFGRRIDRQLGLR
jgi:hypothetical protein